MSSLNSGKSQQAQAGLSVNNSVEFAAQLNKIVYSILESIAQFSDEVRKVSQLHGASGSNDPATLEQLKKLREGVVGSIKNNDARKITIREQVLTLDDFLKKSYLSFPLDSIERDLISLSRSAIPLVSFINSCLVGLKVSLRWFQAFHFDAVASLDQAVQNFFMQGMIENPAAASDDNIQLTFKKIEAVLNQLQLLVSQIKRQHKETQDKLCVIRQKDGSADFWEIDQVFSKFEPLVMCAMSDVQKFVIDHWSRVLPLVTTFQEDMAAIQRNLEIYKAAPLGSAGVEVGFAAAAPDTARLALVFGDEATQALHRAESAAQAETSNSLS